MIRTSLRALIALFGAAALGQLAFAQGVVINEFQYDDSGTDDREFVELYNATAAPVDISGWTLESRDASGANPAYVVPGSTTLAPGAFYVFGPASVPNVNQVVGTTNLWENDNESLTLRDAANQVVDTLVYEANKGLGVLAPFVEGEGIWGNFTSIDANPTSWSRVRDGLDNDDNRDFVLRPITPGASNNVPQIEKYYQPYDALTAGNALTDMVGSFVTPRVIDPTVAGGFNSNAIVPSPQGGNAATCWDPAGGGNAATVLIDGENQNLCVECYAYFDATPEVAGEHETWSIGFQGTTDSFFNTPDPSENIGGGLIANGNTGISWVYQTTDQGGTLFLIDHGNGAWGPLAQSEPRVHAMIPVRTGFNDGWRRLRLQISGDFVEGFFDGVPGCREFSWNFQLRTPSPAWGGVYLGYREFVTNNATLRPLTIDALDIRTGAASGMHLFGRSAPNSTGFAPRIEMNKFGLYGDSNVALRFSNLKPGAPAQLFLGYFALPFPIPLDGLGTQSGVELLIIPDQNFTIGGNINGRDAVMGFTICTPVPGGVEFFAQIFELDTALPDPLPLASSQAMRIVIG
ncbi:MAG: lamin tail domain-containing protein [Planctomycetes bacterium]|nr:lamin tail domain-containing protein [Planctomycetota bacterium]